MQASDGPHSISRRYLLATAGVVLLLKGDDRPSTRTILETATFGARTGSIPYPNLDSFYALEKILDCSLREMSWFADWSTDWKISEVQNAAAHGKNILLGWAAQRGSQPVAFSEILAGGLDSYFSRFFAAARRFPRRIRIRPFHEMNGNWYPWSLAHPNASVDSVEQWLSTWRYLIGMGRHLAPNIEWVWCVNNVDSTGPPLEAYYPGHAYVDVLGIDAYNGVPGQEQRWRSPTEVLMPTYERVERLNPDLPIALCEIGCREPRPGEKQHKGSWMRELLLLRAPRVTDVSFFSKDQWALDTSPEALQGALLIGK